MKEGGILVWKIAIDDLNQLQLSGYILQDNGCRDHHGINNLAQINHERLVSTSFTQPLTVWDLSSNCTLRLDTLNGAESINCVTVNSSGTTIICDTIGDVGEAIRRIDFDLGTSHTSEVATSLPMGE